MGPRDEQQHDEGIESKDSSSEEQATAGAPNTSAGAIEHTTEIVSSPPADSAVYSDDIVFDSRSEGSGSSSFSSSRKTPFHRRIVKIFNRSNGNLRVPLIKRPYGPRIKQKLRSLDGYPQGYGKIAALEACDPNFLIYRKFAWLHNRVLLHRQDELAQLEAELEQLDHYHFREDPRRLISRRRDDTRPKATRKEILKTIDSKLAEYHSSLLRMQTIHSIKRPTYRNQSSLRHHITNTQSQVAKEMEWIHLGPDLVALAQDHEYGKFNTILEATWNLISKRLTMAIFRTHEQKIITGSEEVELLSPARIDVFIRVVFTIIATALLLVPVLILFKTQPTTPSEIQEKGKAQILTVLAFTLLFSASCSIFTKAKRQEVFAATAAYCAVLVVFLGNTSNVSSD